MTGYDRAEIIAALSEIQDTETRTSVATLVKILFDESVYEFDKKEIIQSLTTMPDEQTRISVITLAKPFFAGATYNDGNKIIDILLSLAFIKNLDTRAYTVSLAPLFFTENMGIGDRSEIIDALSEIQDKDSLTQASILAPPLFTKSMTGYDKAEIIRDF